MSVKFALLALLSRSPSTAYQLRREFDVTTNQTWPLNIGQVSTTLQRLRRDDLVTQDADREASTAADGGPGRLWHITPAGRAELAAWWRRPVAREHQGRDELVVKLALAVVVPGVDVPGVVLGQRVAVQRFLHDVTRARHAVPPHDVAARLVLDNHIFQAEAELRWLESVEQTVARAAVEPPGGAEPKAAPRTKTKEAAS